MQLHTLKAKTKRTTSQQVGRGGTRGKTSGRGTKGQKARAGHKIRPEFRDVIKRMPKMRGRGKNSNKTIKKTKVVAIALTILDVSFDNGEKVTPKTLLGKGIITLKKGVTPKVKILGGKITKKVNIIGCEVSLTAKEAVEKAGGTVAA